MYDPYRRPCVRWWPKIVKKPPHHKAPSTFDVVYWCLMAVALILLCVLICILPKWLMVTMLLVIVAIWVIKKLC